jgi:ornithine cyclodeaminase
MRDTLAAVSRGEAELPLRRALSVDELVERSKFYVDYMPAALSQAGELLGAVERGCIGTDHVAGEIGEVILGTRPGRATPAEITVFKSVGIAAEDLALAAYVQRKAEQLGLGQLVEL